ncbi:hypothetical protein TD95_003515 [Thielaviopsis punctulata]|uniref:Glutaredoxin domain-containing protein n=1 Tax=Thielaviopsis punctulata TaxID=72032 RepID=A0A0F4Z8A9_9PEZI|nr:hypothetical protein TD95_003515 [Thielaviopsis punctulata]
MTSATERVAELTKEPIVLFTKSWCPYCTDSKNVFKKLGYQFTVYDLDQMSDGNELQDALEQVTGQRTVPNNFIGGKSVGGNSDLQALYAKGKLAGLLEAAGAVKV